MQLLAQLLPASSATEILVKTPTLQRKRKKQKQARNNLKQICNQYFNFLQVYKKRADFLLVKCSVHSAVKNQVESRKSDKWFYFVT